jgi:transposase
MHTPHSGCSCEACGRGLREIGQDVSEVLDYEPGSFHVVRHVRPKLACARCSTITQAPAPSRPIDRCMAGTGLLAHVLVSKYCDHTPCTGCAKSTAVKASNCSARPWRTGWRRRHAC